MALSGRFGLDLNSNYEGIVFDYVGCEKSGTSCGTFGIKRRIVQNANMIFFSLFCPERHIKLQYIHV